MVTRQDENLGKIHELVIDAEDGRMVCVAPSIGGFMGMVNKLFALPWKAFELHATEHKLIVNVDKEKMKTAPVFDKGTQGLDFSDTLWGESIYHYYDFVPPWKP